MARERLTKPYGFTIINFYNNNEVTKVSLTSLIVVLKFLTLREEMNVGFLDFHFFFLFLTCYFTWFVVFFFFALFRACYLGPFLYK